jgi:myosin heavy subunit
MASRFFKLEGKPFGRCGVIAALDDVWRIKGNDASKRFLESMHSNFAGKHPSYVKPKMDTHCTFGVVHYAGTVLYHAEDFNEKNLENLHQDVKDVVLSSRSGWMKRLFSSFALSSAAVERTEKFGTPQRNTKMRTDSVGAQFKSSLSDLVSRLSAASPKYIRCVKPNHEKPQNTSTPVQYCASSNTPE